MTDPREEFKELLAETHRMRGIDELSSQLIAELFIESGKLSLKELAERTGYSLSAVSSEMKNLGNSSFIKRTKKPGSKKIYFHIEKSLMKNFLEGISEKHKKIMDMLEQKLPRIIDKYENKGGGGSNEEKEIVENYYREIQAMDKIFEELRGKIEKRKRELEDE
ncbi:MAG: GbsR/MarR family transcriptional regulator [Candidatus Aenigmatarchaeota archaeon]